MHIIEQLGTKKYKKVDYYLYVCLPFLQAIVIIYISSLGYYCFFVGSRYSETTIPITSFKTSNMIKKKYKINYREIQYLLRNKKYFSFGLVGFYYTHQHHTRYYNQFACAIGTDISKKSVKRNLLKRICMQYIKNKNIQHKPVHNMRYKFLLIFPKQTVLKRKEIIENSNKNIIRELVHAELDKLFTQFDAYIGKKIHDGGKLSLESSKNSQ